MARKIVLRTSFGLLLFGMAYAILNQHLLTQSILYRAAANDYETAINAIFSFGVQSLLLLVSVVFLPRRWFVVIVILAALSALVNITYGQLLNDTVDLHKLSWMLTEARQAGNAAGEFALPGLVAICKFAAAILLLLGARKALYGPVSGLLKDHLARKLFSPVPVLLLVVAPSFVWNTVGLWPEAAERNVYGHLARLAIAEQPPERAAVLVAPENDALAKKIIWLIDESISHEVFAEIIQPTIDEPDVLDFGEVASMGHCSTPANVALRSGVNVRQANERTDLRKTPSIWGYAQKAGYQTYLIDGQVTGPPQNLLLAPERKLIDSYQAMKDGLRTDFKIAQHVNKMLKSDGKQFAYIMLRGVHFQYRDHFPEDMLPAESTTMEEYKTAVAYSKRDFFAEIFNGVDRSEVAIFYTSDHGQNIETGVLPHCSTQPPAAEFSVPLLAFLPSDTGSLYDTEKSENRSQSQIFPTTLQLMGYPEAYAQNKYDNDLKTSTAQFLWFGRGIFPVTSGGKIELHKTDGFPGLRNKNR